LRLLAGGGALTVVDAESGARSPVKGVPLPPGRAFTQLLPVAGGTVVVVRDDQSGGEIGPGWVYLLRPGRAPVELVRADEVFLGARPGRLWGFVYPRQPGAKATLVEVTTGGRLLSRRPVPQSWQPLADTGSGLLVAAYREEGPGELTVVDPMSLRVLRSLAQVTYVAAATPRMAAWVICGGATCDLVVGHLRAGPRRTFRLDANDGIGRAVFSPDERRLAIAHFGLHGGERPGTPGFVELLDLETGQHTRVPGVGTPEKQAADLSWSPDGRWLAIGVRWPEDGYQRLGVWPVSGGPVVALPGSLPGGNVSALLAVTSTGAAA
ncbi:MAG: TolB family protein, partial [Mycobacteriales bacterium]